MFEKIQDLGRSPLLSQWGIAILFGIVGSLAVAAYLVYSNAGVEAQGLSQRLKRRLALVVAVALGLIGGVAALVRLTVSHTVEPGSCAVSPSRVYDQGLYLGPCEPLLVVSQTGKVEINGPNKQITLALSYRCVDTSKLQGLYAELVSVSAPQAAGAQTSDDKLRNWIAWQLMPRVPMLLTDSPKDEDVQRAVLEFAEYLAPYGIEVQARLTRTTQLEFGVMKKVGK